MRDTELMKKLWKQSPVNGVLKAFLIQQSFIHVSHQTVDVSPE